MGSGLKAPAEPSCRLADPLSQKFIFSKASSVEIYHKYFLYKIIIQTKNNKWNIKKIYNSSIISVNHKHQIKGGCRVVTLCITPQQPKIIV